MATRDYHDEIERLQAEVAAYKRLVGGMKQMIKSFEGCSVIGRYKPYASDSAPPPEGSENA